MIRELPNEAVHAAAIREATHKRLGQSELRMISGDDDVARQRHLEPAPESEPVDPGDHRHVKGRSQSYAAKPVVISNPGGLRSGRPEYEVVEEALRRYLADDGDRLEDVVRRIQARGDLDEDQSLNLAYSELRAVREERDAGKSLDGPPRGRWRLVASPLLYEELSGVLLRPKFRRYASEDEVHLFVVRLTERAELVNDPANRPRVTADPKDDYLVALAAAAEADALVSGDRSVAGPER